MLCDLSYINPFTSACGQEAKGVKGSKRAVLKGALVYPRENVKGGVGMMLWKDLNGRLRCQVGRGHCNFVLRRRGSQEFWKIEAVMVWRIDFSF